MLMKIEFTCSLCRSSIMSANIEVYIFVSIYSNDYHVPPNYGLAWLLQLMLPKVNGPFKLTIVDFICPIPS